MNHVRFASSPRWKALSGVALLFALSSIASAPGCSLVVDKSARQCATDDDCRAAGAEFQGSFCSTRGVCERSVDYCFTNQECIARTGNEATICRKSDHTCVGLLTKQCTKLLADKDDLRDDNTVILGVHGIPSWAPVPASCENAIELTRREFRAIKGGLPATKDTGGKPRPVAFVACDVPIGDQATHKAVTDHLVDVVQVPAMIGPYAADFVTYGLQKSVAADSLIFSVVDDQPGYDLTGKSSGLLTMGLPQGALPLGYAAGVPTVEQRLRTSTGRTDNIKVAYVTAGGSGVQPADAQVFFNAVKFNGGKSGQENATASGGPYYKEFNYGASVDPNYETTLANTVVAIIAYQPDIVVLRGADEQTDVARRIEQGYPNKAYYMLGTEGANTVNRFVGANEGLRKRVLGVRPGRATADPRVSRFDQRYQNAFEGASSPLARACADLTYIALYAAGGLGDQKIGGKAMSQLIQTRMVQSSGQTVDASPNTILRAFDTLQAPDGKIVFDGNEAFAIYDGKSGVNKDWKMQYWCVDPDQNKATRQLDSGLAYNGLTGMLEGATTCF